MKNLIVGNFKMNSTVHEFSKYIDELIPKVKVSKNNIALCVPYTHLMLAGQKLVSTNIEFGSQNISTEEKGAFTGEISNLMVKDLGATFTLVGHSERRSKFKETNEQTNQKIIRALAVNLKVILCIGETKAERNAKKTKQVLKKQLEDALKGLYENELKNIIIAYGPVWAIGTGQIPTNKEIEQTVYDIRSVIKDDFSEMAADNIEILYGGSVNQDNSSTILKIKDVNGLLVGGACLNSESFSNICK